MTQQHMRQSGVNPTMEPVPTTYTSGYPCMSARIILYSGKGGVGKTSMSAANALALAKAGHRTLLVSTDPAHSLGDVFGQTIGSEPTEMCTNLFVRELSVRDALEKNWSQIGAYIETFLASQGLNPLVAAELATMPGMMELMSLLDIVKYEKQYDAILLDCAPTGSTTSLLAFPDAAQWYMDRFFKAERMLIRAVKPIAERLTKIPLPEDPVFGQVETLYQQIRYAQTLLQDHKRSSIRLVATPEHVVLAETRRALCMFQIHDILVDAVILNRVYPTEHADHPLLGNWVRSQQAAIASSTHDFAPLPLYQVGFQEAEPQGMHHLQAIAQENPELTTALHPLHTHNLTQIREIDKNNLQMKIFLPLEDRSAVRLWVDGADLVIMYHAVSKRISLPAALQNTKLNGAAWEDSLFCINFVRQ